jgi:hypothetical protein
MTISTLKIPPAFATGDVVGRHNVGLLIANDEYWNGQVGRWRGLAFGIDEPLDGLGASGVLWDGYILKNAVCDDWVYYAEATDNGAVALTITLKYALFDGTGTATIATLATTPGGANPETLSGTFDASGLTDGTLYKIWLEYSTVGRTGARILFRCPYAIYDAAVGVELAYTTPHAIADTDESATTEYDAWRNNDLFFQDAHPVQHGQVSFQDTGGHSWGWSVGHEYPLYWAWVEERWNTLHYSVQGGAADNPTTIRITYDEGGPNEEDFDITVDGTIQTGHVHPTLFAFDEGEIRKIQVTMVDATDGGNCWVHYLYMAPDGTESLATSFVSLAPAVGAVVYGNTTAAGLLYLNDNDAHINATLEGSDIRRDYAVATVCAAYGGGGFRLRFVRRGDTLYYRVKGSAEDGCSLKFGTAGTYTLTDYDNPAGSAPATGYQTLNLDDVTGLVYGMSYYIEMDSTGDIDWAVEV